MKKILFSIIFIVLAGVLLLTNNNSAKPVKADSGNPATITATYNSTTHELTASGTWGFDKCPDAKKGVGFALFTNDAVPDNTADSLDGESMHLVQVPCTTASGSWGPDTHTSVDSAPSKVCVVIYDVHLNDVGGVNGHDDISDGENRNTDNSYEKNDGSFPEGSCITPEVITPSPTPTPTPTPTATPTPSNPGGPGDGRSDGLGCGSHDCSSHPQEQVLGASTGPQVLGLSTTSGDSSIALSLMQLGAAFGFTSLGFGLFRKHA